MDPILTPLPAAPTSPPPVDWDHVKATGEQAIQEAKAKWEALVKDGLEYVKANPGKSVLGALGAGFVLGSLFRD